MTGIVYPNGSKNITVAALDKISASSAGPFTVSKIVGYPNHPDTLVLLDSVDSEPYAYTSAAFTGETVVVIEPGASPVEYWTGTDVLESMWIVEQPAPTAMTGAATITVGALATQLITGTQSTGATVAYTLPTGTVLDAGVDLAIGQGFDFRILNLSAAAADTITLTANTGITIVGVAIVQSVHVSTGGITGATGTFRLRKTAANTFVCYRIA
jgi:hypothetical protein